CVEARYQATPPSRRASLTRSTVESKNAPRGEAVPDALATAPSSTSGRAVSTSSSRPARSAPLAIAIEAPTAMTRPVVVRWLAVMPVRRSWPPTGRSPFSKLLRHRPSNMVSPDLPRSGAGPDSDRALVRCRMAQSVTTGIRRPRPPPSRRPRRGRAPDRGGVASGDDATTPRGDLVKRYDTRQIRNVALVGHSGAGKTSLAEALLHRAGAIGRLGRVEDGTTTCDHDPEEHKRGISLSLAVAPFEWQGTKINLIDTPGYADFMGDVSAALRVADLAVFVVSAVDGVQVQTEEIWEMARELGLPRMVFVNKLDRERADHDATLAQLRDRLGPGIAPLELPIGTEADFRGIADLLTDTAHVYEDG